MPQMWPWKAGDKAFSRRYRTSPPRLTPKFNSSMRFPKSEMSDWLKFMSRSMLKSLKPTDVILMLRRKCKIHSSKLVVTSKKCSKARTSFSRRMKKWRKSWKPKSMNACNIWSRLDQVYNNYTLTLINSKSSRKITKCGLMGWRRTLERLLWRMLRMARGARTDAVICKVSSSMCYKRWMRIWIRWTSWDDSRRKLKRKSIKENLEASNCISEGIVYHQLVNHINIRHRRSRSNIRCRVESAPCTQASQ